jgi:hypothetical protein
MADGKWLVAYSNREFNLPLYAMRYTPFAIRYFLRNSTRGTVL